MALPSFLTGFKMEKEDGRARLAVISGPLFLGQIFLGDFYYYRVRGIHYVSTRTRPIGESNWEASALSRP